jgi:hypothetical protein
MTDLSGEVSPLGGSNDRLKPVSPSRRSQETQSIQSNAHWNMGIGTIIFKWLIGSTVA